MYEYCYVKIELKSGFAKLSPKEDYREVIDFYAKEGWRFVQIFAPPIKTYGMAPYFEIIFEKEINKNTFGS